MLPAKVEFTGLIVEPLSVLSGRIVSGPIPTEWTRVRFELQNGGSVEKINRWLHSNINQKWASYIVPLRNGVRVAVIAFESDSDAVMFRLKGGETAWKELPEE